MSWDALAQHGSNDHGGPGETSRAPGRRRHVQNWIAAKTYLAGQAAEVSYTG